MNLFPELKNKKWAEINLNAESLKNDLNLADPNTCNDWIDSLHKIKRLDYSYGGFLEDRSNIWKNQYNRKTGAFMHLGIDFNVPEGTKVALLRRARVTRIIKDKDQRGGWGGMVLWKLLDSPNYLIYGHLKHNMNLNIGEIHEEDEVFAEIGAPSENGGWWPHLHLQMMDETFINEFKNNLSKIDGYLPKASPLLGHVFSPMSLVTF